MARARGARRRSAMRSCLQVVRCSHGASSIAGDERSLLVRRAAGSRGTGRSRRCRRVARLVDLDELHWRETTRRLPVRVDARVLDRRARGRRARATSSPGSVSSTRTAPRFSRSRWRSRIRSIVASSSGWPGQTNAASGLPGTLIRLLLEGDPLVRGRTGLAAADLRGRGCGSRPGTCVIS